MSTVEQAVKIETGNYDVDTVHSQVGFEVKHLGISTFRGSFGAFSVALVTFSFPVPVKRVSSGKSAPEAVEPWVPICWGRTSTMR